MYFSAAASSENDQGSMNLASKTAALSSTMPSRVAIIHGIAECWTRRWTFPTMRPVFRSYQERLSSSVTLPSCTMRLPERSSGSASPRFSRHRRTRAARVVTLGTARSGSGVRRIAPNYKTPRRSSGQIGRAQFDRDGTQTRFRVRRHRIHERQWNWRAA
jgi:hypothetical protein